MKPSLWAKILLVDDEPSNLLALEAVLEGLGQELVRATSGREALRHLMHTDFAVILLDVQMPTMDGLETALLIRSRERSRHTPIIFLTAVDRSEEEMLKGYKVGAVDYMIKPFLPDLLRYKVKILLEWQQHARDILQINASLEQRVRERTAELETRGEQLARSNEALNQFASVVSHDLQAPLRTMNGYLHLLERSAESGLTPEARSHLGVAMDASARMSHLISDLLTFSRAEASADEATQVDCGELLEAVLAQLEAAIQASGAKVSVGPLPVVRGQALMLGHLLQNLIENGIKFCQGPPRLEVGSRPDGEATLFWVKDNGIGIPAEQRARVFELFHRLHSYEEFPGTGMGLALCKRIVERHGGRIWVEPTPGGGSTFYFTLHWSDDRVERPEGLKAAL